MVKQASVGACLMDFSVGSITRRSRIFYATGGIVFGLLFSTLLMFMRARFFWWPFHPIGFVVSSDWGNAVSVEFVCW